MNKRERTHGGSASAIIIAILFLALMATLGVVFYQNFIQEKSDTKQEQSASSMGSKTVTKAARVAFNNMIYAMDYPENGWDSVATPGSQASSLTLTNKAGDVAVSLVLSRAGESLPCNVSGEQIGYYNVSSATAQSLAGVPLYLVEAIYDHHDGGYDYTIGLTPDSGDTHSSVGASTCDVAHVGAVAVTAYDGSTLRQPAVYARILLPKFDALSKDGKAAAPDMQTIKDLMSSEDYKAAVKILESARKE
jgi:hypothetical protein